MSEITKKSPKHCGNKKRVDIEKLYKRLIIIGSTLFTTILAIILLVWVILRPTKPQFSLKQADMYQLNLSTTPTSLINSSIQLTLSSENPNTKIGVYYDELQVYATYKGQQITVYTDIPPFYQGHQDSNLLSASLAGTALPVAPSFGYEVGRDRTVGRLILNVKVNGRIRWRVGTWVSTRYRLNVNCVAVMVFGPDIPTGPISTRQGTQCSTSV